MMLPIVNMAGNCPFPPRISRLSEPFWRGLERGRFLARRCDDCGHIAFPPQENCAGCGGRKTEWIHLSGRGRLYSLTAVHAGPPALMSDGPYCGAIIDLNEDVRLVTRWLGDARPLDSVAELVVTRYADVCLFAARGLV